MNPLLLVLLPLALLFFLVIAYLIHMMRHLKSASHHPLYEVPSSEEKRPASVSFVPAESLLVPATTTATITTTLTAAPLKKGFSVSKAVKPGKRTVQKPRTLKAPGQKLSNPKKVNMKKAQKKK